MSKFSGVCDLYDTMMMEKQYEVPGGYASDELECFEIFKKKTGGVLHQMRKAKVTECNQDFIKAHCAQFDIAEHESASGQSHKAKYTYIYWGKEYDSLKALNKKGVYIDFEIPFETLLDLIPYYPYAIAASSSDGEHSHVVIADSPEPQGSFEASLADGYEARFPVFYNAALQRHYLEVCRRYFLKGVDARAREIEILGIKPLHNGYYELCLDAPADYMHPAEYVWDDGKLHSHWESPKIRDAGTIWLSEQDVDGFLRDDIKLGFVKVRYVEKTEFERVLQ